jgi:hypothetical protein
MSFNGSGVFQINSTGQPVVAGTVISSTAFNALTADLATGLSTCVTKDGQTTPTANLPMANYKFTGLGAGTDAGDSANLGQVQSTVVKLIGSISGANTITGSLTPALTAYATGQMFYFVAAGDNTGAVTLNLNSLGAKNVTVQGTTALSAGQIKSGQVVVVVYDGTRFQLVNYSSIFNALTAASASINTTTTTFGPGNVPIVLSVESAAATANYPVVFKSTNDGYECLLCWHNLTTGTNAFINFGTETTYTNRGSINYNRGAGLVAYNTTSDRRAKTIYGPVTNSGEIVDQLNVYTGKMNWGTDIFPMLLADEAQQVTPYCVTGDPDAVDPQGNPVYQQMDYSALVPLLLAEIQSLRTRVAALEQE